LTKNQWLLKIKIRKEIGHNLNGQKNKVNTLLHQIRVVAYDKKS